MATPHPVGACAQIIALPSARATPVIQQGRNGRHPKSIAVLWRYRRQREQQRYAANIFREEQETLRNGIAAGQRTLETMRYMLARNQQLAQIHGHTAI